ncbi:putative glycerate dehydrogenase [Phaeomoniella chlamydospora]|uniref:Putative glycerate dehydrogenase n=1 Tax=Phaeomoniella chlamydospora TaxID=158046 RepID=A0A0G2E071_PHACM|nr:putative glycerate dehydrogenase [Phaeomoniella chlamydospora]
MLRNRFREEEEEEEGKTSILGEREYQGYIYSIFCIADTIRERERTEWDKAVTAKRRKISKMTGQEEHHVVCLQDAFCPVPTFDFPHKYTRYLLTGPSLIGERLQDATIGITTIVPITAADLDRCPKLQAVIVWATGYGWVEKAEFQKRGIVVMNTPQTNVESVSEHTIALYFAARRKVVELHAAAMYTNEWVENGGMLARFKRGPPRSASMETMVIFGYGSLGKRIEGLAKALGMKVLIADRKGVKEPRAGRIAFEEGLEVATVVVVVVPREKDTIDMIDEKELRTMNEDAILINVARGGIINEKALVVALKEGWIAGAATDVLEQEPSAPGQSPLLDDKIPNLTVSPHVAWYSEQTILNLQEMLKKTVESFVKGEPINVVA